MIVQLIGMSQMKLRKNHKDEDHLWLIALIEENSSKSLLKVCAVLVHKSMNTQTKLIFQAFMQMLSPAFPYLLHPQL